MGVVHLILAFSAPLIVEAALSLPDIVYWTDVRQSKVSFMSIQNNSTRLLRQRLSPRHHNEEVDLMKFSQSTKNIAVGKSGDREGIIFSDSSTGRVYGVEDGELLEISQATSEYTLLSVDGVSNAVFWNEAKEDSVAETVETNVHSSVYDEELGWTPPMKRTITNCPAPSSIVAITSEHIWMACGAHLLKVTTQEDQIITVPGVDQGIRGLTVDTSKQTILFSNGSSIFEITDLDNPDATEVFVPSEVGIYDITALAMSNDDVFFVNANDCGDSRCNAILKFSHVAATTTTSTDAPLPPRRLAEDPIVVISGQSPSDEVDISKWYTQPDSLAVSLAVDDERLYWSDKLDGAIRSVPLAAESSDPWRVDFSQFPASSPRSLTHHPGDTSLLFMSDVGTASIQRLHSAEDGWTSEVIYSASAEESTPLAVVYHPHQKMLYFSQGLAVRQIDVDTLDTPGAPTDVVTLTDVMCGTGGIISDLSGDTKLKKTVAACPQGPALVHWGESDEPVALAVHYPDESTDALAPFFVSFDDSRGHAYFTTNKDNTIYFVNNTKFADSSESPQSSVVEVFFTTEDATKIIHSISYDGSAISFAVETPASTAAGYPEIAFMRKVVPSEGSPMEEQIYEAIVLDTLSATTGFYDITLKHSQVVIVVVETSRVAPIFAAILAVILCIGSIVLITALLMRTQKGRNAVNWMRSRKYQQQVDEADSQESMAVAERAELYGMPSHERR